MTKARKQRLKEARIWYPAQGFDESSQVIKAYRQRFNVDRVCAMRELCMLKVLSPERQKNYEEKLAARARKNAEKREARKVREVAKEFEDFNPDQDGNFFFMTRETIDRIRKFTEDREWEQFHTPANLAKSISIEANELLECFQWSDTDYDLDHVKEELADVMVYCRNMLDCLGLDEDEIINDKMAKNEAKYPVGKARGIAAKYDQLTRM